jgi:hypothetical protein
MAEVLQSVCDLSVVKPLSRTDVLPLDLWFSSFLKLCPPPPPIINWARLEFLWVWTKAAYAIVHTGHRIRSIRGLILLLTPSFHWYL